MSWWQQKLTGEPSPLRAPVQSQQSSPPAHEPSPHVTEDGKIAVSDATEVWGGTEEQRNRSGRCDVCGSTNYWEIPQRGTYVPKCFDCGRIVQFGSDTGTGGSQQKVNKSNEVAGAARQPKSFYTGAHTSTIVGRV